MISSSDLYFILSYITMKRIIFVMFFAVFFMAWCDNTPPPEPIKTQFKAPQEAVVEEEVITTDCWLVSDSENMDECWTCLNLAAYSEESLKTWASENASDLLSCYGDWECYLKKWRKTVEWYDKEFNSIIKFNESNQEFVDRWLNDTFSEKEVKLLRKCEENRYTSFENALPSE